jgi:Leucine-rich repeat (LRR) protein
LDNNRINRIPENAFNAMRNLRTFSISGNSIRNFYASSFGSSLESLNFFISRSNQIRAFDEEILTRSNLSWLYLSDNNCVSMNFNNVQANLDAVRASLSNCFEMFRGFINCSYEMGVDYACRMTIQNVQGRNDFNEIDGNHLPNQTNFNVRVLESNRGDSRNIPSVICKQFPNLRRIYISTSFIQIVNEESFEDCLDLQHISLPGNEIIQIPDFTFANNQNLRVVEFFNNHINFIGANAFGSGALTDFDVGLNRLREFNPQWLANSRSTIINLFFEQNQIEILPPNSFEGMVNLRILNIGHNNFREIPSQVFQPLIRLQELWLNRLRLTNVIFF